MTDAVNPQQKGSRWQEESAADNTHNRVIELAQKHLQELKGKKVCDLPCGLGALSVRLAAQGMQVTAVDIEASEPFLFEPSKRVLADANQRLPFADGEFDAMFSIEGVEHLENPSFFLRECARIVKPGGLVFVSTPNVDSFRSRRSLFAHGYHRYFLPVNTTTKMACHLLPIDMTFFRGAAQRAGLVELEVGVNKLAGKSWFRELLRPVLTRKLPPEMQGLIPYYGDVIIYVLRKTN